MWLDILGSLCERFNWRWHAWVQTDNDYHQLLKQWMASCPKGQPHYSVEITRDVYLSIT